MGYSRFGMPGWMAGLLATSVLMSSCGTDQLQNSAQRSPDATPAPQTATAALPTAGQMSAPPTDEPTAYPSVGTILADDNYVLVDSLGSAVRHTLPGKPMAVDFFDNVNGCAVWNGTEGITAGSTHDGGASWDVEPVSTPAQSLGSQAYVTSTPRHCTVSIGFLQGSTTAPGVVLSNENGSWNAVAAETAGPVVSRPDGTILVASYPAQQSYYESRDRGATWSFIEGDLTKPIVGYTILGFGSEDSERLVSFLLLETAVDEARHGRTGGIGVSSDGGASWNFEPLGPVAVESDVALGASERSLAVALSENADQIERFDFDTNGIQIASTRIPFKSSPSERIVDIQIVADSVMVGTVDVSCATATECLRTFAVVARDGSVTEVDSPK